MRYSFLVSFFLLVQLESYKPQQINFKMEKFDINAFNVHKVAEQYNRTLSDGTIINQLSYGQGYIEKTIPLKGWFYTYKTFNEKGSIKSSGLLFKKGDYKAGLWISWDEQGNKIEETNFDGLYKLSIDSVLSIVKNNGIKFSLEDDFNSIKRIIVNSKGIWFIKWREQRGRMERIQVDDMTGKIIEKDFYLLEEDH